MSSNPNIFKLDFSDNQKVFMTSTATIEARFDGIYHPLVANLTESQFSNYIQTLISELEKIEKDGKRKFALAKPNK
jgi:hypothetical protein